VLDGPCPTAMYNLGVTVFPLRPIWG
jgi:hypothetical protein